MSGNKPGWVSKEREAAAAERRLSAGIEPKSRPLSFVPIKVNAMEYGRLQVVPADEFRNPPGSFLMIAEIVSRDGDFWLPLRGIGEHGGVIGHVKFKAIAPHTFVIDEVRQADGPVLNLQDVL